MPDREVLIDVGAKVLEAGHRLMLKVSGGRYPRTVMGMQPVELHAIGRKTGERRSTLLTAPICEESRVVLVASKGGAKDHPIWYKNIVANPDVELTINERTRRMRARTASPEEKADLWPTIVGRYKGYAEYQRSTEREIPVVICEPDRG
ncbi:MAG TPA: nitroreductase/quinone reductase family protein [Ilumatobacteraceae bacterium]|nr:nitroreductase/quinone reductase family protein [Ilumatobacteraceae bacterium]